MAAKGKTQGQTVREAVEEEPVGVLETASDEAFYDDPEDIPENDMPLHASAHSEHAADEHHPGDIHMADELGPFIPEGSLDAPEPQSGMSQRWVRMGILGRPDAQNRATTQRQGWKPRALSSVPVGMRRHYPAFRHKTFGDVIMQGDLVLCERPIPLNERERDFYAQKSKKQTDLTDVLRSGPATTGGFHQVQVVERRKRVVMRRPIQAADGG